MSYRQVSFAVIDRQFQFVVLFQLQIKDHAITLLSNNLYEVVPLNINLKSVFKNGVVGHLPMILSSNMHVFQ